MPEAPRTDDTVTLRIKFKSENLEKFIERYAVDVSPGGIFIRTREPLAVGTSIDFEFTLGDGTSLLAGLGTVVWVRETDASRTAAPGMGLRFDKLRPAAQAMLSKILAEKARREKDGVGPAPAPRPSSAQMETIREPASGPRTTRTPARGMVPRVAPPVVADLDSTVSLSSEDLMDGRLLPQKADAWENESEKTEIAALPPSFYYEKADAAVAARGPAPVAHEDEDITHPRLQMPAPAIHRAPTPAVGSPVDRPRMSGVRPVVEAGAMQTATRIPPTARMPTPAPLPSVGARPNPAFNRTMMGMPAANPPGRVPTPPPLPVMGRPPYATPTPATGMPAANFGRMPTPAPLPIAGGPMPGAYPRLPTPAPMPTFGAPRLPTPYPMPQAMPMPGQPRMSASFGVQGGMPGQGMPGAYGNQYGQPVQNGYGGYGDGGYGNGVVPPGLDAAPATDVGPRKSSKGRGVWILGGLLGGGAAAAGLFLGPQVMELVNGRDKTTPPAIVAPLDPPKADPAPGAATVTPLPTPAEPPPAEPEPVVAAVAPEKQPDPEPAVATEPRRGGRNRSTPRGRTSAAPREPRPTPEPAPEPAPVAAAPAAPSENDVYWLAIRSTPSGAEVLIDGETEGKTPFDRRILDPSRTYAITVRKDGFDPFKQNLSGGASDWNRKGSELRLVVNAKLKRGEGEAAPEKAAAPVKKDNPFDSDK